MSINGLHEKVQVDLININLYWLITMKSILSKLAQNDAVAASA